MRYIYTTLYLLVTTSIYAQQPETITGRVELGDGRFVIESFTAHLVGDSLYVEMGDLKLMDGGSPTTYRFAVPAVFAVPVKAQTRRRIDPTEYAGQMKVTVVELSEQDNELVVGLDIRMRGDVMNRRLSYLLIPEMVAGDSTVTGAGLLVNGRGKDQLYRRRQKFHQPSLLDKLPDIKIAVTNYTDTLVRYSMRLPYEIWMDEAVLDIHQVVGSPAGKEQLYTIASAGRVKLQPREPYEVQPQVNFILPEREEKLRKMQGQAYLDFAVGRSVIVPTFRRNPEELAKIEAAIRKVQSDADVQITGLFVEGYASPEGSYVSNERLARERSQALANYITQNFGIAADLISVSSTAEDWDGLRILVEESDLVRKAEVLAIIDSTDEPDRKEARLKALGYPWTAMSSGMFPQLRRVEYQIDFSVKDYSVEESRSLAARIPEMLSQRELFLLAQSYQQGSPQWENIFETIIRHYPDDTTAILNYAAVLLGRGELASAKRHLDRVADRPEAADNLGVYYLLSGDLYTAEAYLRQAAADGSEQAAHNLTELETKRDDDFRMQRYKNNN
ncbi:MAG: OmpA family protein [Rikenellaceae bacterium]|nr:OmpA family protein [Rikenellaceae bacterium]